MTEQNKLSPSEKAETEKWLRTLPQEDQVKIAVFIITRGESLPELFNKTKQGEPILAKPNIAEDFLIGGLTRYNRNWIKEGISQDKRFILMIRIAETYTNRLSDLINTVVPPTAEQEKAPRIKTFIAYLSTLSLVQIVDFVSFAQTENDWVKENPEIAAKGKTLRGESNLTLQDLTTYTDNLLQQVEASLTEEEKKENDTEQPFFIALYEYASEMTMETIEAELREARPKPFNHSLSKNTKVRSIQSKTGYTPPKTKRKK